MRVSIPNGMEFYLIPLKISNSPFCFNSQRDGILLGILKFQLSNILVSIPNGMEFYIFKKETYPHEKRFNSQRDGILLCFCCLYYSTSLLFQFPTGWNSTELCHLPNNKLCEFQFPTGWNSTLVRNIPPLCDRVSIPNGMEFYNERVEQGTSRICFNSQRDGILQAQTL